MKYLMDTHVFIWEAIEPEKLSEKVAEILESSENKLFISIASLWEMQIKLQLKKLTLPLPLSDLVRTQQQINHIEILPIEISHIYLLEILPLHHRDPFDRLLIAQSILNNLILVSKDSEFSKYPINLLW